MSETFGRIAIVGAGQVGTMLGLALRGAGAAREVALFDRDADVVARSLARGAGDRALADVAGAFDADATVLALPVPAIREVLMRHGSLARVGSLVIDTGSVKGPVVESMRAHLAAGVNAIGGHPLAGTERPGPEGADAALLRGATFALVPVRDDPRALALGKRFALAVGACPRVVGAAEHDRAVARTSGLPHLLAFALARAVEPLDPTARALAATGYAGATRLASSDPAMVAGLLSGNAVEVRAALADLGRALDDLAARLDDAEDLARALGGAR